MRILLHRPPEKNRSLSVAALPSAS
jgi:hypothetical protein